MNEKNFFKKVYNGKSIHLIEDIWNDIDFSQYDKFIIGIPSIHSEPAIPIKNFLNDV